MGVDGVHQRMDIGAGFQRQNQFGQQFPGIDADNSGTQQFFGNGINQQLGQAVRPLASARPDAAQGNTPFS